MAEHDPLSVSELASRDVRVTWHEAVAVVLSVCDELVRSGAGEGGFPVAGAIWLGAAGDVRVTEAGDSGEPPAARAGRLLNGLLDRDAPVQLRLLVSRSTDGQYDSLGEFSKALAYFDRPDRQGVLRQLYDRASLSPARAAGGTPAGDAPGGTPPGAAGRPRRRWTAVAGLVVAAGAIAAALAWAPQSSGYRSAAWGLGARALGAVEAVTDRVVGHAGALASRVVGGARPETGTSDGDPMDVSEADSGEAAATPVSSAPEPAVPPAAADAGDRETVAAPADGEPGGERTPQAAESNPQAESIPPGEAAMSAAAEPLSGGPLDAIYSFEDAGVLPPVLVRPQLSTEPPPPGPGAILELVVGTNGEVESVRLVRGPRDVRDSMLVSAAKNWRFEPATLDGVPVRYRHQIAIPLP